MTDQGWTDEREIEIDAQPEAVWAAWAEPEHVRRWFSDDASGTLEPGGELVHRFDGFGDHRYQVVEVQAPRRLVLDGGMGSQAFRQTVEIRRAGGRTVLRLVHSGFGPADPDDETVEGIDSGWTMALATFKHYVENYLGRDKVTMTALRPARFAYRALLEDFYLDPEGLGAWLTDGQAGVEAGEPVALTLRGGRSLTGSVLALTDHEVALSWDEAEAVLELKAFGSGPDSRMLGARLISWRGDAESASEVGAELQEAVERLTASL